MLLQRMTWRVRRQLSAVRFPALAPFWTMAGERRRFDRYRCQCESHVTAATWLPLLLFPLLSGVPIAAGSLVGSLLQLLMLTLLNRYKHRCITSLPSLSLSYLISSPIISSRSSLSLSLSSFDCQGLERIDDQDEPTRGDLSLNARHPFKPL